MAIKQRALNMLNFLNHYVHSVEETRDRNVLSGVVNELNNARIFYQSALPAKISPKYVKLYDNLLRAVQNAMKDNSDISKGALSLSEELLQRIIDKTAAEDRFKKEIFFLPYQAAMWDSLESVWKAAYNDTENCIAYVMPIPYADRNPDGSPSEWRCERDKFPSYVPTLDWQQIDLKAIHPDVIYFHNPYDNLNLITSVEGRYYSSNLKECTDKLIYIPYFILDEPCTEESVEHFATAPGVFNADKVIVQSEDVRRLYIDVLTKKTNQPDRAYWEAHILGFGSPKIDKVLSSKKEDFDMPERWLKLIQGKKVILYNTSIAATLTNADKVCDKLRYVFDFFRNRDDAVLWWRPHPLMKSTLHSMQTQVEAEYLALEKQYIEDEWGIYDDSPDLHRAICWSDAYYGDGSSVVKLYRETGKFVMIQNMSDVLNDISLTNILDFEGELYFTSFNFNGLFKYDKVQNQVKLFANFDTYPLVGRHSRGLFFAALLVDRKIYFFPYCAKDIYCCDIATGENRKICITYDDDKFSGEEARFLPIQVDNSFWIIRGRGSVIIKFNITYETYHVYNDWFHALEKAGIPHLEQCFFSGMIQIEQYLYFVIYKTNIVIRFSMRTYEAEVFHIGDGEYVALTYDGVNLWLYSINSDAYCVDILSHNYDIIPKVLKTDKVTGNAIIYKNGKIYAFQDYSMDYAVIDTKTHSVSYVEVPIKSPVRTMVRDVGEKIYILPFVGSSVVTILSDKSYQIDELKLEDSDVFFYRKAMKDIRRYDESDFINLSNFLEDLNKEKIAGQKTESQTDILTIGQQIYSITRDAL